MYCQYSRRVVWYHLSLGPPTRNGASIVGFEGVGVEGEALLGAWSGDEVYEEISLGLAVDVAEPVYWILLFGIVPAALSSGCSIDCFIGEHVCFFSV